MVGIHENPIQQPRPTWPLTHFPCFRIGDTIRKVNLIKFVIEMKTV